LSEQSFGNPYIRAKENTMIRALLFSVSLLITASLFISGCNYELGFGDENTKDSLEVFIPDTSTIPNDEFGKMVRYGIELMNNTSHYIGPQGIHGKYTGNRLSCSNCHQNAGTKPFALNLVKTWDRYPQYRARENKILTMQERVNNCITRPHSGIPLPYESEEMLAYLCYFKWLNTSIPKGLKLKGEKPLVIPFINRAANPETGAVLFKKHCERCHGANGEGKLWADAKSYEFPPLWGLDSYQPGSSMHRVIKQAQWLKANMPKDMSVIGVPFLTDEQAFDLAAFVNDDRIHDRIKPKSFDYPNPKTKALDYGHGPYADTFSELQHKFGPYQPILDYWLANGLKATY